MEKFIATSFLVGAIILMSVQAKAPFDHLKRGEKMLTFKEEVEPIIEAIIIEEKESALHPTTAPTITDTIPDSAQTIEYGDIEMTIKNGKIVKLRIDGKTIPKDKIADYEELTDELRNNLDEAYSPPLPPLPPIPPTPPAPAISAIPMPPAPPSPPAPPLPDFHFNHSKIITKKKDSKGNTIIIIEDGDSDNRLEFDEDDEAFYLDGMPLDKADYTVYPPLNWEEWVAKSELPFVEGEGFDWTDKESWAVLTPEIFDFSGQEDMAKLYLIPQSFGQNLWLLDTLPDNSEEKREAEEAHRYQMDELRAEMEMLREKQAAIRKEYMEKQQDYINEMREKMHTETKELRQMQKELNEKIKKEQWEYLKEHGGYSR